MIKYLTIALILVFSCSAFATVCEIHPILGDIEYLPVYAYVGAVAAAVGLIMFVNAFLRKNDITAFNQLKNIIIGTALMIAPGYMYYDLSHNYGFTNQDFMEYEGKINTCSSTVIKGYLNQFKGTLKEKLDN